MSYNTGANAALATLLALGCINPARAQDTNLAASTSESSTDIVVTATRRNERIQDIPLSITALGGDFIKNTGAQELSDVVTAIPGLSVVPNGGGASVFTIRGINTSSATTSIQAPVAVYVDEVPVLDPFTPYAVPQFHLYDIERVETLRGPQGTLFGAGALGGAIRFITKKPNMSTLEFGSQESIQTVDHGGTGYEANLMVNVPLIKDQLALRTVGYYTRRAGWVDNPGLGEKNSNHLAAYGGRAALAWQASDSLKITGTVSIDSTRPNDSSYTPYGAGKYISTQPLKSFTDNDSYTYNIVMALDLPWASLTETATYLKRNAHQTVDFSGTAIPATGIQSPSAVLDNSMSDNYIQELRLASRGDGPLTWIVGLYYQNYKLDLRERIVQDGVAELGYSSDLLSDARYTGKVVERAIFGEVAYKVSPEIKVTLGGRLFNQSVGTTGDVGIGGETLFDGPPNKVKNGDRYTMATPRFNVSYTPNRDLLIYATASKGYRAGQGNLFTGIDPISNERIPSAYGPDELWNYEIGTKISTFDGNLIISADAYYIDWQKIPLETFTSGLGLPYTDNVGNAEVKGAELEIVARPFRSIETGASLAYTHGRITALRPNVDALVGDQLPGSAPFTSNVYGQYNGRINDDLGFFIRGNYAYVGNQFSYLNNPESLRYGKYNVVSAQAGVTKGKSSLVLRIDNLTNESGRVNARDLFGTPVEVLQQPRTIGITFNSQF